MQKYSNVVINQLGAAVSGASIAVFVSGTSGLASLYSNDGVTPTNNPTVADGSGRFGFYAPSGKYDLQISGAGIAPYTLTGVLIADIFEFQSADEQPWQTQTLGLVTQSVTPLVPPPTGQVFVYAKADNNLYFQDATGREVGPLLATTFPPLPLLNNVSASGNGQGASFVLPSQASVANLVVVGTGVTGASNGCQVVIQANGSAVVSQSFTPASSIQTFPISANSGFNAGSTIVALYSCLSYPATGTISASFNQSTTSIGSGGTSGLPTGLSSGQLLAAAGSNTFAGTSGLSFANGSLNLVGQPLSSDGQTLIVNANAANAAVQYSGPIQLLVSGSGAAGSTAVKLGPASNPVTIDMNGNLMANNITTTGSGLGAVGQVAVPSSGPQTAAITAPGNSICPLATCGAGLYEVSFYVYGTVGCATVGSGSVGINVIYTDATGAQTAVVPLSGASGVEGQAMAFTTGTTNQFATGSIEIYSAGTAAISYSTTYTACSSGTGTYTVLPAITKIANAPVVNPGNPSSTFTLAATPVYAPTFVAMGATNTISLGGTSTGTSPVVVVFLFNNVNFTGITGDSTGANTWVKDAARDNSAGGGGQTQIWHCQAPCTTGITSISTAASAFNGNIQIAFLDVSGADTNNPVDVAAVSSSEPSGTTTATGPSVTPTFSNDLIVTGLQPFGTVTGLAAPFNYTHLAQGDGFGYVVNGGTTTYTPQWTLSLQGSFSYAAVTVAYKSAPGGGGGGSTTSVTGVSVNCPSTTLNTGAVQTCTAVVSGTGSISQSVTWSVTGNGSINSSTGVYTAGGGAGTASIVATSVTDATVKSVPVLVSVSSTATITGVTVSCAPNPIQVNQTSQCTAVVTGTGAFSSAVTWSVVSGTGSINSAGVYTAGASTTSAGIKATSIQNSSVVGTTTLTVNAASGGGTTVLLSSFGSVGHGGNDAPVFNQCLSVTAAAGQICLVPAGTYILTPSGPNQGAVSPPAGSKLQLAAGVTINSGPASAYGSNGTMFTIYASNVSITGAGAGTAPGANVSIVQGQSLLNQSNSDGVEYRHALAIGNNVSNITISGIGFINSGGDGMYVRQVSNCTISNCVFSGNFRNQFSCTGQVNGLFMNGNTMTNGPRAGCDFEPNSPSDFFKNVNLNGNTITNNVGGGWSFGCNNCDNTMQPISINITNNVASGNGNNNGNTSNLFSDYGFDGINESTNTPSPPGLITLTNSSSTNSAQAAISTTWCSSNSIGSIQLNVSNFTSTNSNHLGGSNHIGQVNAAIIAVDYGGTPCSSLGNMSFSHMKISGNGGMQNYFAFTSPVGAPSRLTFQCDSCTGASNTSAPTSFSS